MNQEQNNLNSQNNNDMTNNFQDTNIDQSQINQSYQQPISQINIYENNTENLNTNIYNQQIESIPVDSKNKSNKKLFFIIGIVVLVLIIAAGIIGFNIYKNHKEEQNNTSSDILVTNQLWNDYQEGKISTDEYVRYSLYAEYDKSLLDKKYSNLSGSEVAIHTDELVEKYYDELSDETLKYYISQVNLENVTFELDKENEDSDDKVALSDLFIDTVYAKSDKATNLNKATLSKNGNFVVWYTTTGNSATDYDTAKKVADGLEETISQYADLTGKNFQYKSNVFSKGKTYKNQLKILEKQNIDTKYLESAMQVYIVEADFDALAKYIGRSTSLIKAWQKLMGGDQYGVIANPYIMIKPSSFSESERLEQLYNHELFHHYQYEILCGSFECTVGSDLYILEATANWASSITTTKTTNEGFLNEYASVASRVSSNLMSDEFEQEYGLWMVGYSLYPYLYNYSNIVDNGAEKIINSIYENNSFQYLSNNSTKEELNDIQKNIALKNITQDYTNKNLNAFSEYKGIKVKNIITTDDEDNGVNNSFEEIRISPIGIDYYQVYSSSEYAFEIDLIRSNPYISAFVIAYKDGKYNIVGSTSIDNQNYIFDTNDFGEYEYLYIAVANLTPHLDNEYSIKFKNTEKNQDKNQTDKYDYISLLDCDAWNEYLDKTIATYYYDKEGKVVRYVVTNIWTDIDEAKENYENVLTNGSYTNAKLENKTVTYEHTENSMKEYWGWLTKDNVISSHNMACGDNSIVENFKPGI